MSTLANCRLTEETLEQFGRATRRMLAALRESPVRPGTRPAVGEAEEEAQAPADRVRSVAAIARQFERIPALSEALAREGMSAREYVVVQLTLFQSSVAAAYLDAEGPSRMTELPRGTTQENVDFVRAHRPQIAKLTSELRQLSAQQAEQATVSTSAEARQSGSPP